MMNSLPNGVLVLFTKDLGTVGHKSLRDTDSMIHLNLCSVKATVQVARTRAETLSLRLWAQAAREFSFFTNPLSRKLLWVPARASDWHRRH